MSNLTSRFDPAPDGDYGVCAQCGINLATQDEANAHMSATFEDAKAQGHSRGHGVQVLNPDRKARIEREVGGVVDRAIQRAMDDLDDLVSRRHVSAEEVRKALTWYTDFQEAWDEYNEGDIA